MVTTTEYAIGDSGERSARVGFFHSADGTSALSWLKGLLNQGPSYRIVQCSFDEQKAQLTIELSHDPGKPFSQKVYEGPLLLMLPLIDAALAHAKQFGPTRD